MSDSLYLQRGAPCLWSSRWQSLYCWTTSLQRIFYRSSGLNIGMFNPSGRSIAWPFAAWTHMMISFMRVRSVIRPRSTLFDGRGLPNFSQYTVSGGVNCSSVNPSAADHKYCVVFFLLTSSIPWMAHITQMQLSRATPLRFCKIDQRTRHRFALNLFWSSVEIYKHCGVP